MDGTPDRGDEGTWVRRARRGDREALSQLYAAHARAVYTLAVRLTGDHAAAEDIAQDTFMRLVSYVEGIRDDAPLRPWLKKVAANLAIDRLRRERTRGEDAADVETLAAPTNEPGADAEATGLLRRLSPLARTLVWLHEMEGWSHPELGRRFGRSESWSKSIVSRSLGQLRRELEEKADA